jgi:hypothetical protein
METPGKQQFRRLLWIFADLPAEVIDKLQIDFYSDPSQAAFKALAEV